MTLLFGSDPTEMAGEVMAGLSSDLYIRTLDGYERTSMAHVRLTEFRQNIATYFDQVLSSRAPLLVTRQGSEAMVLVAEGEYESMQETLHLLSTPANSARLRESLGQLREGQVVESDPTL
ncbi:type II toxin-antitoxin system Phd/YefM family antitoxin [Rhizobium laguerreae]|uniref:Antitoxin n=3 Tax=Rhizobium/Agrobacterium group TaxID=227290 RepID=A0AAX2QFD4_9HYPH|nr:type II toxin-antitoxin system prevent-host-death family antitoxin [Rhizobium laguerreae]TCU18517.1 prevent-host-death family protein [Rhizobium laguerreae]